MNMHGEGDTQSEKREKEREICINRSVRGKVFFFMSFSLLT